MKSVYNHPGSSFLDKHGIDMKKTWKSIGLKTVGEFSGMLQPTVNQSPSETISEPVILATLSPSQVVFAIGASALSGNV